LGLPEVAVTIPYSPRPKESLHLL